MSKEFSFDIDIDIDENSINKLKEEIGYNEIEARHKRFMEGTETIDDLINGIYHYRIKNDNGLDLDVVEFKYYNKIIDLYDKEKEKNKKMIEGKFREIADKNDYIKDNYISKDKIKNDLEVCKKVYEREMKPYQREYGLDVSLLNKKEKAELINKRNCLITQMKTYEMLLEE